MALTQIIRQQCKECGKIAVETSRTKIGKTVLVRLACGHILHHKTIESTDAEFSTVVFADGMKPRPYQFEAVSFAERANFRCIIADEQGLGKTIEICTILKLHSKKVLPAVIVVPTTVKKQWMHEIHRICGDKKNPEFLTQIIQSGKEFAMPGFQIYIITYDMLKNDKLFSLLPDDYVKLIVIDECQRIKNHQSARAKAVQKVAKNCEYVIPMSGTPIKNNAGEYFTVLNLVKPTMFTHWNRFIDVYCDSYNNGWGTKVGGLKDADKFHGDTKDIIIRRTKNEVLKDLPSLERKFFHCELNRKLNKDYEDAMNDLDELMYDESSAFEKGGAMIAIMQRLRHITGTSKVKECVAFIKEFLVSTAEEKRKLVVFTHHIDVQGMIQKLVDQWLSEGNETDDESGGKSLGVKNVSVLSANLDGDGRANLVYNFKHDENRRIMIASTLAAGEGLNLQFCSDAVLLERQWNPANEEQAEARFHRFGQKNNVSVTYMLASGTIDEYFTELVEVKRAIVASTMDNKEIAWDQQSLMKELAEILVTRGKKSWKL